MRAGRGPNTKPLPTGAITFWQNLDSGWCTRVPGAPTDVGAYSGTTSPYGGYDMAGNVFQLTDTVLGVDVGARGGGFGSPSGVSWIGQSDYFLPANVEYDIGFRLASIATIPEPSSNALAALGLAGLVAWGWRRR